MNSEMIQQWQRERAISRQDALQSFLQIIVLKNLSLENIRLIGGTALVLGQGNPRFSEDLDFANVSSPLLLEKDIQKAVREADGWLGVSGRIVYPKPKKSTWRLVYQLLPSEAIQLHIDSQPYPAHTHSPVIIRFPGIPSFIKASVEVDEIMADKLVALVQRQYLSGRDLFDLWYHWLSQPYNQNRSEKIIQLLRIKLREHASSRKEFLKIAVTRISGKMALEKANYEWKRYLPVSFQKDEVFEDILKQIKRLPEILAL